jgi:hypothetical protein
MKVRQNYNVNLSLIHLKRIYNFLCSMLVLHQLLYVLFTLRSIFMRFLELTYCCIVHCMHNYTHYIM